MLLHTDRTLLMSVRLTVNTPPMFAKHVSVAVYTCKEGSAPPFGLLSGSLCQHSSIVMLLCDSVGEAYALIGERKRVLKRVCFTVLLIDDTLQRVK